MAVSNDNGIAVAEIKAVFTLKRNKNNTVMTKTEPTKISVRTPLIAVSMKLAGRNKPSCKLIFWDSNDGLICLIACSSA